MPEQNEKSLLRQRGFRRHSVYKLNQSLVDWDALEAIVFGDETPQKSVGTGSRFLIIDEINRANISKVFGELITLEPDMVGMPNEIRLVLPYSKNPSGKFQRIPHIIERRTRPTAPLRFSIPIAPVHVP